MSITLLLWHFALHKFLWYRYALINLIMCNWHLRPKYVFLSRHIFRGSNLYYIELFKLNWHILLIMSLSFGTFAYFLSLLCAKAKTNMFSWASHVLSLRLKGKWSIRQRHRFHSTPLVLSNLCRYFASPLIWYNLHSHIIYQRGSK